MKNVPILGKFIAIMGVFGAFAVAVAVYSTSGISNISTSYSEVQQRLDASATDLLNASRNLMAARVAIADLLISTTDEGNERAIKALKSARDGFDANMDKAIGLADQPDELRQLKAGGAAMLEHDCAHSIELGRVATASADVIKSQDIFEQECAPKIADFAAAMDKRVALLNEQVKQADDLLAGTAGVTVTRTFEIIFGGLAVVMTGGFVAMRGWVVVPLRRVVAAMLALAGGNLSVNISNDNRRDEIGQMSRAVQIFKDAALDKQRVEEAAVRERAAFEATREADAKRAAAEATQQQERVVRAIAAGLDHLAHGDLRFRIEEAFPAEYEMLRVDFNRAMDSLLEAIRLVASKSDAISTGTSEINQASQDLAQRTQRQASHLAETTATLSDVTAAVGEAAKGATLAKDVVSDAKQRVEKLGNIVRETISAMEEIEGSSSKIGQIIGVIDEIAFQTNLLALNAGVEAARAGEAGRGFAVVASEVRGLAQRSAEAAKEIKVLIHTSAGQTGRGVRLVGETGETLADIVHQVGQAHDAIVAIANSMQSQAGGLRQVNTTMGDMDQVTQQNAAMVEQSTAATQSLAQETGELVRLANQFRLQDDAGRRVNRAA